MLLAASSTVISAASAAASSISVVICLASPWLSSGSPHPQLRHILPLLFAIQPPLDSFLTFGVEKSPTYE